VAVAFTRCARPELGRVSTYTVLGFAGYAAASILAAVLFVAWDLPVADRLVAAFAPPLAFLVVVAVVRTFVGTERIVFYQTATAGVVAVAIADALTGGQVARAVDIAALGIGTFLVFGRVGCFSVACCHGRPARFGVVYGDGHVRVGLWERFHGRPLWPTQLVECVASLVLVVAGLVAGWDTPGLPATIYASGYAAVRFVVELFRGDAERPHRLGASEAQWTAPATAIAIAIWRPGIATIAIAAALVGGLAAVIALRRRRELVLAPHLRELDRVRAKAAARSERFETSLGVAISRHALPDGRTDWVLSATHPAWSVETVRRLADVLWPGAEIVPGRAPGVIHVIA
jgi:prolipoprotein diacylglyceryltransferase